MGISIIRGAISSGKSAMCLDMIEKIHNERPDARCIMIVPDHYSYETERRFVERFGGIGLNNIEVLTLRKMATDNLSARELNHLTGAGKQMLIYKAVTKTCDELAQTDGMDMRLIASMRRRGFVDVASSLISELKRYLVTPDELHARADSVTDNRTLKNKLTALCGVYEKYTKYVDDSGCTDSDDDLYRLAERIEASGELGVNTYVWVNRFDKFMPQQLAVIEALLKKGVHMTVSVCCPDTDDETERSLYAQTEKTLVKIEELAARYGLEGVMNAGDGLSHLKDKADLYRLMRYWAEDFVCEDVPQSMALFQSRDAYGEVERIACKIVDLVRDEGCRFRDIALLCGDEEEYRHLIEAVFDEYEIPYFTDRKIILSDHPIAMQILSLFGIFSDDWSYDAMFRYLRSGFIYRKEQKGRYTFCNPINQEEIDLLENFVLKYGIRGGRKWLSSEAWSRENDIVAAAFGETDETAAASEMIEKLREEITAPLVKFREKARGRKTAREFASALFEYLEDINLYTGLKYDIAEFKRNGMLSEAEQFTKIWNLILDVLHQTTTALGDDKMNIDEFAEFMSVGLSQCEIRIIPSGIDQVYVGSVERSSHTNVKVMFVLGAKSGTFPTNITTEGFLSNRDRQTLHDEYGITLAPDTKRKMDEQYFKVYRALCAVSDRLYLSYSVQNEKGASIAPSHMVLDIYRKFPNIRISDNLMRNAENDGVYISSPKATVHRMLINMSPRCEERKNPLWDMVYEWYDEKQEWKRVLSLMNKADYYSRRGIMLDSDIAQMLYEGKTTYSASRINTFARCPFEYFLKYGLGVRERDVWDVTPANMGSYAHKVINDFCKIVEEGAKTPEEKIEAWKRLDDTRRDETVGAIIDATCKNMLESDVRDKERTAGIFARMGRTIANAAALVQKSLCAGSFSESGMECDFELDISDNVALSGKIDRIDTCVRDEKTYMRIIDYKTGKTEFDVVNIANGYDMQMVLYAIAASEMFKENNSDAQVTGIYYTAVRDKYIDLSGGEERMSEKREKELRLDGETFAPEDENERKHVIESIDSSFFEKSESLFSGMGIDKNGGISGVRTTDEVNGLMDSVKDTVLEMDGRIRAGDIDLNPYCSDGRYPVCAYCTYSDVCKFDEQRRHTRDREGNKKDVWESMRQRGAKLRGVTEDGKLD